MSKKPLLYPQRQRCRVCRRYWSFSPPIRGLYCSPECAGRPPLEMHEFNGVMVPPRTCRTRFYIKGGANFVPEVKWKAVFANEEDALAFGGQNGMRSAYECPNCWWWHVATRRFPYVLAQEEKP